MSTCTVVMYHYVRDAASSAFPNLKSLSVSAFEAQLDFLQERYRLIDYPTFDALLQGTDRSDEPTALLTFDDGFVDHHEIVWPILARRGLSGVFFVAGLPLGDPPRLMNVHKTHFVLARLGAEAFTQAVLEELARLAHEGALDLSSREGLYRYDQMDDRRVKQLLNYELPFTVADEALDRLFQRHLGDPSAFAAHLYINERMIRQMARAGMAFGWHTETHRVLSRLSIAEQRRELARGVAYLSALTGRGRVPFCYPYGHAHTYTPETLDILADCGYASAFTVVRKTVPHGAADRRYELPRFDCKDLPPFRPAKELSLHA